MTGRPVDAHFPRRMRELLAERGLSYRTLATRVHYGKTYLHALATGRRTPTPEAAQRIDRALNARGELLGLATGTATEPVQLGGNGWHHADNEALADALLAEKPNPHNAVRLAHEWLIADAPQVYELRSGRRIDPATVGRVEQRAQQLRLLDDHVGGTQTHTIVAAELDATASLLREAAYTEPLGRRLLVAVANLCQLAGFVAADAGRYDDARRLHLTGLRAGHAGGSAAAAADNLSTLAYVEANVGNPHDAVTLARSAWAGARTTSSAVAEALLLERLAWAYARADEAAAADRALGAVEETHRPYEQGEDPPWTYWLTADEVGIMAGRVWTELRRPLRAVPILERAIASYGDDVPRETALYLTWLAEALLQAGEVERSADAATRALRLARRAGSQRALDRIEEVRAQLVPYMSTGGVAAFEDEYRA